MSFLIKNAFLLFKEDDTGRSKMNENARTLIHTM